MTVTDNDSWNLANNRKIFSLENRGKSSQIIISSVSCWSNCYLLFTPFSPILPQKNTDEVPSSLYYIVLYIVQYAHLRCLSPIKNSHCFSFLVNFCVAVFATFFYPSQNLFFNESILTLFFALKNVSIMSHFEGLSKFELFYFKIDYNFILRHSNIIFWTAHE
jgi:hypothetical protein